MAGPNSDLEALVRAYRDAQDVYKLNEYRNSLLLSVGRSNEASFVHILSDSHDKEDDPADRKKVLQLFYEVASRTEDVFAPLAAMEFLSSCLKLTICVQLSVSSAKALVERHFNETDAGGCQSIKAFYELLLAKKISQYPQQCRLDFLFLSNYLVDGYLSGKVEALDVEIICDAVGCEKDPRNLLRMFDLIAKLARHVAREEAQFEHIAKTYSIYYPIQFVPPKRDKIQITPLQLKKALLECFIASERLAPYSMQLMIDSLYSEFATHDQHLAAIMDTLYFLKRCKPVYGRKFGEFAAQLLQVIRVELLEDLEHSTRSGLSEPENPGVLEDSDAKPRSKSLFQEELLKAMDKLNLQAKHTHTNGSADFEANSASHSSQLSDKPVKPAIPDISEVNRIGDLYYKNWKFVDEKLRLFGEILALFLDSVPQVEEQELNEFLGAIAQRLPTNPAISYLLDVLCQLDTLHVKIVDLVVVPLLSGLDSLCAESDSRKVDEVLTVLGIFVMPKILAHCKRPYRDPALLLSLINLNRLFDEASGTDGPGGRIKRLKLLLLAACITDSDLVDKLVSFLVQTVFHDHLKVKGEGYDSAKPNLPLTLSGDGHTRERMQYLEILVSIYKCHPGRSRETIELLTSLLNHESARDANEVPQYVELFSYMPGNGARIDVSLPLAEIFRVTLARYDPTGPGCATELVRSILRLALGCTDYLLTMGINGSGLESYTPRDDALFEMVILYASLLPIALDCHSKSLLAQMLPSGKSIAFYQNLLDLYMKSMSCEHPLHPKFVRLMVKAPRLLSAMAKLNDHNVPRYFCGKFKYLNLYFGTEHTQLYPEPDLHFSPRSSGNLATAFELMNLEASFTHLGSLRDPVAIFEFKYVNGPVLVAWVEARFKYDFKNILHKVKSLKDYKVSDPSYADLFFMLLPMSLDVVPPMVKAQLIDIRRQFGDFALNTSPNRPNGQEMYHQARVDGSSKAREWLLRRIHEMLRDGSYEIMPSYDPGNLQARYSKVELYVAFFTLLLHGGTTVIESQYQSLIMDRFAEVLNAILEMKKSWASASSKCAAGLEDGQISVHSYVSWICDKYLLYLQALMFLVLSNLNSHSYEPSLSEAIRVLFSKDLEGLLASLIQIYDASAVPFFRILSILTIHGIMSSKVLHMAPEARRKVVKRCKHFLGDPNRKVRTIAVLYKEQWMASLDN